MSDNPFAAPESRPPALGVRSGRQADVLAVARYQKGILWCILGYLSFVFFGMFVLSGDVYTSPQYDTSPTPGPGAGLGMFFGVAMNVLFFGVLLAGVVFTLLLAIKVYHPVVGVFMGVLAMLPCIGLLALLIVNSRATNILKQNGFRVGLLGANLKEVRAAVEGGVTMTRDDDVADEF